MNRRDAVQYISLLVGGTLIGSQYFLEGCKSKTGVSMVFTPEDVSYLDEVADTILPATKTPGAKAAHVGQFMTVMVNDCYEAPDQKIFHEGLAKLNDESQKKNNKSFMESTPQQRHWRFHLSPAEVEAEMPVQYTDDKYLIDELRARLKLP